MGQLHLEVLARISHIDERGEPVLSGEPHKVLSVYISTLRWLLNSRSRTSVNSALRSLNENLTASTADRVELDLGVDIVTGEQTRPVNLAELLPDFSELTQALSGILSELELQPIPQPVSDPDISKD
jgi:hypothetical protein